MDRKDLDVTLYLVTDSSYHTEESLLSVRLRRLVRVV